MNRASNWTSRFANRTAVRAGISIALALPLVVVLITGVPLARVCEAQYISADSGNAFYATVRAWSVVWPLSVRHDTSDQPTQSNAIVLESGQALGPAHAMHDEIRSVGKGRYSHWGSNRAVYFSSSDNSDPRTNGRTYTVRVRALLPWWCWLLAGALLAYAGWSLTPALASFAMTLADRSRSARKRYPSLARTLRETRRASEPFARVIWRTGALVLPSVVGTFTAVLLIGGLGEVYFRATVPFTKLTWPSRHIEGVGWLFEPNAIVRHSNFLDYWVEETTNSQGFLDREASPVDPATSCRVAIIGDSFVEAAQVHNVDKVQSVLERRATEGSAPLQVSAAAYGYSGTGQLNQLPFYDRYAAKTSPHLVVLVFVQNDFANNSAILEAVRNGFHPDHAPRWFATRDANGHLRLLEPDPNWQKYLIPTGDDVVPPPCALCERHAWLVSNSLFYRWITFKLRLIAPKLLAPMEPRAVKSLAAARAEWLASHGEFVAQLGNWRGDTDVDFPFNKRDLEPVFRDALEFTEYAFAEWKKRVEANGGKLAILSGSRVRTTDAPKSPDDDLYFGRMRAMADKLGIPVLDQYGWLKRRNEPLSSVDFRHDGHWTVRGHEVAAEMILEHIRRQPAICPAKAYREAKQ